MNDAELTEALRQLGVDRHTIRALPLLPLVQVAWADGRVQASERGLIREVAERYGLDPREMGLLKRWLAKRPTKGEFLLARQVLLVVWSRDRERGAAPESLEGVIRMCMCVARVAGGLFGLAFTVDPREMELISEISRSLQLGPTLSPAARAALPSEEPSPPRSIADDETRILPSRARPQHAVVAASDGTDDPDQTTAPNGLDDAADITTMRMSRPPAPDTTGPLPPRVDERLRTATPREATPRGARRRQGGPKPPANPLRMGAAAPKDAGRGRPGDTLLPPDEEDASTMPLASLRRILEEEDETELDLPMLPPDYDFELE